MENQEFEYRISARLPLSGQFLVTRHTVDRYGKTTLHSTLDRETMKWFEDASFFSYQHRFDTALEAGKMLRVKLHTLNKKTGPTIFVKRG